MSGLEQHVEAHPSSPLFARLADSLLKNGEITKAIDLCERGLKNHPGYTTGRLIYARSLAARERFPDAVQALSPLLDEYPGNIVLEELSEEWSGLVMSPDAPARVPATDAGDAELIPADGVSMDAGHAEALSADLVSADVLSPVVESPDGDSGEMIPDDATPAVATPGEILPARATPGEGIPGQTIPAGEIHPSTPAGADPGGGETDDGPPPMAEKLPQSGTGTEPAPSPHPKTGDTAGRAQTVPDDAVMMLGGESHPSPLLQSATGFVERDRIISRTLAEIYASQGATREAVETYRLLMERRPEMREALAERLRDLEDRLRTQPDGQKEPLK